MPNDEDKYVLRFVEKAIESYLNLSCDIQRSREKISMECTPKKVGMNVKEEVMKAYRDCNDEYEGIEPDLDFLASKPVPVEAAVNIMREALSGEKYNKFYSELIRSTNRIFEGHKILLARENSVCIYVVGGAIDYTWSDREIASLMHADETEMTDTGYRIWWD